MNQRGRVLTFAKKCVRSVSGTTLVEIAGDRRVLIEHHCGVLVYNPDEVCVKTTYGCLTVSGCNLYLSQMTESILVITGKVSSVMLRGG